ncbi:MAG: DsbA family protein [Candidatus Micrarchaeota archaeon]|nr:DsbA family protein [Candidatus Micrarchaeota archaeon]
MLCFVALFVFGALSVFSAKYRPLAARAFDCAARKITLRPCQTGLDDEIRAASIAGIMRISPPAAAFANRHFEALSVIFTLIFFASMIVALQGIANFAVYGNCNGPEGGFCIYSGLQNPAFLKTPKTSEGIVAGNLSSGITVVEFGCYICPYTKEAEEGVQRLLENYASRVAFVYKPFPLAAHKNSFEAAIAASCAGEEGKYWEYRKMLFANQSWFAQEGERAFKQAARKLNLTGFDRCYDERLVENKINATLQEGKECGIYGTPTFFVNGKAFVGQRAAEEAEAEIRRLLAEGRA